MVALLTVILNLEPCHPEQCHPEQCHPELDSGSQSVQDLEIPCLPAGRRVKPGMTIGSLIPLNIEIEIPDTLANAGTDPQARNDDIILIYLLLNIQLLIKQIMKQIFPF